MAGSSACAPQGISPRQGLRLPARQRKKAAVPGPTNFARGHRSSRHAKKTGFQMPQMPSEDDDYRLSATGMVVRITSPQRLASALTIKEEVRIFRFHSGIFS